jgi:signal transduction histidine kinase/serine phosphatase RsbU (regulator of sigma subunit)
LFGVRSLWLWLLIAYGCASSVARPDAQRGVVDARGWGFSEDILTLEGDWAIYWNQLLTPEEARRTTPSYYGSTKKWPAQHGAVTMRLVVLVPPRTRMVTLLVGTALTASEVYLDGQLVGRNGVVSTDRVQGRPQVRPVFAEHVVSGDRVEVLIRASNWDFIRGGVYAFRFGDPATVRHQLLRRLSANAFLMGAIFIMAIYHLGLFAMRRGERAPLYFASLCLGTVVFNAMAGDGIVFEFAPWLSGEWWWKAFYCSWLLSCPSASYFIHALYPDEFAKKVLKPQLAVALGLCAVVVLTPLRYHAWVGHVGQLYTLLVIGYALVVIARAHRHGRHGALQLLAGIGALSLGVVSDIFATEGITKMPMLSSTGLLVLILGLSLVWAQRIARAYAAVEESQRSRTALFHNTSHELRTPLNGILGFIKLLRGGHFGDLSPGVVEPLHKIQHLASGLLGHVNTILDLARSQHGRFEVRAAQVRVLDLVTEAKHLSDGLALREADLHFKLDVPWASGEGPTVLVDRDKVLAILRNLIGNAFKFRKPGAPHTVTLRMAHAEGLLSLSVSDTGIGIGAADQARIFEAFTQVQSAANRAYEGTGLGLALVQKLVDALKGRIRIESVLGQGSTFHVELPAPESEPIALERSAEILIPHDVGTANDVEAPLEFPAVAPHDHVLVVDDNPTNLELVQRALGHAGYKVETAGGGAEALRKVARRRPDIVLLDLMMPEVSGEDVLRAIRDDGRLHDLPVILLTARASDEDRLLGLRMGADDYLAKPVDPSELVLRVRNTLLRAQLLREKSQHDANLAAAQAVQQTLLPNTRDFPCVEVIDHYQAAELTGGDWFGYSYDDRRQRLFVAVGDATGHGVSASLVTGTAAGAFKASCFSQQQLSGPLALEDALGDVARALNHALLDIGTGSARRMTMALVAMDLGSGGAAYLNAGHQPVLVVRDGRTSSLMRSGPPLGVDGGLTFSCEGFPLAAGDRLLLFTDGLVENEGPDGRMLSVRRVQKLLGEHDDLTDLKQALLAAGAAVWKNRPAQDDCSFVLVRFRGPYAVQLPRAAG